MVLRPAYRPLHAGSAGCISENDLVIGVAQSPSSLNPYIDAEIIKGYILGFAQRPITSFDGDWKLACLRCTEVPTLDNGLARREIDAEGRQRASGHPPSPA
jgi:peptide/nickel transport system substrate-binding protein